MAQTLTPDQLHRLVQSHDCNLSKVAYELGITPQRVKQLCELLGVKVVKSVVRVEPTKKSLLYPSKDKGEPT